MDELTQVDPKLFVTCRLCLEDLGQYQIVPSVQQQIKYCFDIEVEPFDGLPQLLCTKCKDILTKFYTVKTTYCEKQTNLRKNIIKKDEIFCNQQQQDTVSSTQQPPETVELDEPTNQSTNEPCDSKKKKSKRKRLLLHSSSSSDSESEKTFQTSKAQKKKSSTHRGKSPMQWEADYKKMIACKLCNTFWSSKRSLANHNRSHELIKERFKNIFNRQCTVNLVNIDNKPNITGLSDMVVHSSNKIIAPGDSYYYTIYLKDDDSADHSKSSNDLQKKGESKCSLMSSDGEDKIVFKPTQRKRRLISRSSNETVVIESNSNKIISDEEDSKTITRNSIEIPLNNDQCINIDDSSDSESDPGKLEKSGKVKQPIEAKFGDYKIIHGIISMCVNSYHKKNDSGEVDMNVNQNKKKDKIQINNESQLKHKLLSIGRKIINRQGFSCTGILRFMEHKSLDVVWIAKAQSSNPKDTNYIRILTKLRGDLNLDDDPGWISVSDVPQSKSSTLVPLNNSMKVAGPNKTLANIPVNNEPAEPKIAISLLKPNVETSQPVTQIKNQAQLDAVPAMLSVVESKASTSDSKKLLNANPVANPKKLPKKLSNESRLNKVVAQQSVVNESRSNKVVAQQSVVNESMSNKVVEQQSVVNESRSNKVVAQQSVVNESRSNKIVAQQIKGIESKLNKVVAQQSKGNESRSNKIAQQSISNESRSNKVVARLSTDSESTSNKIVSQQIIGNESRSNKVVEQQSTDNESISNNITLLQQSIDNITNDDSNFCMPIITSTTSLAPITQKAQTKDTDKKNSASSDNVNNTETPVAPRIKVKPASELMSERTLDIMKEQATTVSTTNMFQIPNVWPHQNRMNVFVPNIGPQLVVSSPPIQILQLPTVNPETTYKPMPPESMTSNSKTEYVILDTTDFPNTKTGSPIKYVKDLLQLHNLFLLDPHEILPNKYLCLIKFKVVFKQDHLKDSPVVLCLSLLCYKNNFCFQVRDRNQEIIDMTKISGNWQWEILQTYRGDVSNKVLQNARKFGQEIFDLTNNFFCLLKSINCRKPCAS